MAVTRQKSRGSHVAVTWQSRSQSDFAAACDGSHVVVWWQAHGGHIAATSQPRRSHAAVTSQLRDGFVVAAWRSETAAHECEAGRRVGREGEHDLAVHLAVLVLVDEFLSPEGSSSHAQPSDLISSGAGESPDYRSEGWAFESLAPHRRVRVRRGPHCVDKVAVA